MIRGSDERTLKNVGYSTEARGGTSLADLPTRGANCAELARVGRMRGEVANKVFTASPLADLSAAELPLGDRVSFAAEQIACVRSADPAESLGKRLLDVGLASLLLLVLAPALLIIALAIFVESGGPVIFRQDRGGLNGRIFTIYKFRTMLVGHGGGWTARDDDRITPLGGFLRRTSLDELPQLFNVVLGDMSLVGPRPHAAQMDDEYRAHFSDYDHRLRVRPGITGLAQVSDLRGSIGELEDMRRRLEADVAYIERWSLGLDLKILAKTVPHLLASGNSY